MTYEHEEGYADRLIEKYGPGVHWENGPVFIGDGGDWVLGMSWKLALPIGLVILLLIAYGMRVTHSGSVPHGIQALIIQGECR